MDDSFFILSKYDLREPNSNLAFFVFVRFS